MQTRGVFGLIVDWKSKKLLLSERQDGKGWNLPGGRVEEGESDETALIREVREETGLHVVLLNQVGPPHVYQEDTAVAYLCSVIGGELIPTTEAKQHRYVDKEEIKTLTLVGPEGRLGRTGRMVWDALSILEEPTFGPNDLPTDMQCLGVLVSDDGSLLVDNSIGRKTWPRLDPYSPTGKMEPKV